MRTASAEQRRTYWPRAGPVGIVPDLGDDRPCENCGYNLRGIAFDTPCPECGSLYGVDPDARPIAWNDRHSLASYFSTIAMVLFTPRELAGHVWRQDKIWLRPARRFRAINVMLATLSVTAVAVALSARAITLSLALCCAPFDVLFILWWFIALTHEPDRFLRDKGSPIASLRARAISTYLSAPLALSPLHLVILLLPDYLPGDEILAISIALHTLLIIVQLILIASAESVLLWQLVEIPRSGAFAIVLVQGFIRAAKGAIYVVALPALAACMANSLGGR